MLNKIEREVDLKKLIADVGQLQSGGVTNPASFTSAEVAQLLDEAPFGKNDSGSDEPE
jgi:hypothetical protein